MKVALLLLVAVAALVLRRRRRRDTTHVVVAWRDGAELELREGAPDHERMVAAAGRALA